MAKLQDRALLPAEFARQSWRVTPPSGVGIDEVLEPDYWANVASKLTPHDVVEVVPEDGAFYARLFVVSTGKLSAKMQKLEHVTFSGSQKKATKAAIGEYEVKFSGPSAKWRVHKEKDGALVTTDSFQTREEAEAWLEKNIKDLM